MYERLSSAPVPPRPGCCIWFTGLSGAGKSTTAVILARRLEEQTRTVTVLDGDIVRTHLSRGLGFSKEDRDANVRRIGFVAAEVVRHGGIAICAAVSPYRDARADVRAMVDPNAFCEVYVNTDLATCERRDPKGMYAAARRGEIKAFTGVDDPYEAPLAPELVIDTIDNSPEDNAERVLAWLRAHDVLQGRRFVSVGTPTRRLGGRVPGR
jgi:sulfate adenylyltransferase